MATRAAIHTRGDSQPPLKAAIYTRVSKDMRDTGRSVDQQEAECRAWVDREPTWKLAGVWSDNDKSASQYATKARPDWERLLDEIEDGNIDVLVVWEPSRATRDRGVWASLAALCEENDVKVAASGRLYDLSDAEDAFQLDLFFSLAARESRVTSKRIKRDQRGQAAKGRPHGRHLYGYRREYDPAKGELLRTVPDDALKVAFRRTCMVSRAWVTVEAYTPAGIMHEVFGRLLKDISLGAVEHDLNMRGIRSPRGAKGGWHAGTIRDMVLNPGYIGRRIYQGKDVGEADWPPLISLHDFYALEAKLSDPSRRTHREFSVQHLLSRIIECGVCGAGLTAVPNGGSPLYRCMTRKATNGSRGYHVGRNEPRTDAIIRELVVGRLSMPDAAEVFARGDSGEELKRLLDEVAEKRARLAEHYRLSAEGEISPMAVAAVEATLLPQIETAEARMKRVRLSPLLGDLVLPDADQVAAVWDGLEISQKREVIRTLFEAIRVHPLGRGRKAKHALDGIEIVWRGPADAAAEREAADR